MGVNINNLDALIKKNNLYLSSFNDNSNKLINCINELRTCYSGNSLEYLFSEPMNEIKNVKTISNVIESYSNALSGVKDSYQKQDLNLKTQLNHMNSNLL